MKQHMVNRQASLCTLEKDVFSVIIGCSGPYTALRINSLISLYFFVFLSMFDIVILFLLSATKKHDKVLNHK
jgi:amino acid transporter